MKLDNQKGIASIIITIIMSLVLSLIALGFTQVSLRQQKEALDSALSTQAFYSAESGVNYAVHEIFSNLGPGPGPGPGLGPFPLGLGLGLNPSRGGSLNSCPYPALSTVNQLNFTQEEWTCLSVNFTPKSLIYNIQKNSSVLVPIQTNHHNIKYINISWRNHPSSGTNFSSCQTSPNSFPSIDSYNCPASVLQVSIIDGNQLPQLYNPNFIPYNFYLTPTSSNSTNNWSTNGSDNLVQCSSVSGYCNANINLQSIGPIGPNINQTNNGYQYYLYIVPLYATTKLYVTASGNPKAAVTNNNQNNFSLYHAQVDIDSTGKGYNVLRRILVTVNTGEGAVSGANQANSSSFNLNQLNTNNLFALQTGGNICKQLSYDPNTNSVNDSCSD